MPHSSSQSLSFVPTADAAVLLAKQELPESRPASVGPIFDIDNARKPIVPWSAAAADTVYPPKLDDDGPAPIPSQPADDWTADHYLPPQLARNERLRLNMLWYYTRNIASDAELLTRLQDKACLARDTVGWEFAIVGLLGLNEYTRLATKGLPLAILPRRESTCAHTINQPPGSVFLLPNMADDWRFRGSPHVEIGGLRSYAGVPLRLETEFGDSVALGSLCVASNTSQEPINKWQQSSLARLADWIVADIIQSARVRRQRERRHMSELLANLHKRIDDDVSEDAILDALKQVYPRAKVEIQSVASSNVIVDGRAPIPLSDLDNGVWEDIDYLDWFIETANHQDMPTDKVVRVIAGKFDGHLGQSCLVVASNHLELVFDDVDLWFVQGCASMLSRIWHKRMLTEAKLAKEKFLRGMTHQLRTPIHGILGAVDLLAEELQLQNNTTIEKGSESGDLQHKPSLSTPTRIDPSTYINTIKAAGQDLISIVNSIITLNHWADIAGRERGDTLYSLDKLETELANGVLQTTSGEMAGQMPTLIFNRRVPPHCDSVVVDLDLLRNSLLPLILNATQHTPGGTVAVTFSITPDCGALIIDVEDTGCGIDPADQRRVFDAYEKVHTHSTRAGLGLTLASRFASLLGGEVALVSSAINEGSHFRATFRQLAFTCMMPTLRTPMAISLARTFHQLDYDQQGSMLSNCFANFLTSIGFTPSDQNASLILLDYVADPSQRAMQFSRVKANQVAICLAPTVDQGLTGDDCPENILYMCGPFLTANLVRVLEDAQVAFSKVSAKLSRRASDEPFNETKHDEQLKATGNILDLNNALADSTLSSADTEVRGKLNGRVQSTDCTDNSGRPLADGDKRVEKDISTQGLATARIKATFSICSTEPQISKPTVLLVDDNAINLRIMTMYCKKRGLPHHAVTDGLQATEAFANRQTRALSNSINGDAEPVFKLVLMDMQMPVCDGIQATRQIRALEKEKGWEPCLIFIITGQDSPMDRAEAGLAGANDYLVKPVTMRQLDMELKRYFPNF
ncbi:histidine kinase HHK3 [Paramyrothecium foliicola]|nr:histidine kinase HHK3 [Paramyrothecium foliicola]